METMIIDDELSYRRLIGACAFCGVFVEPEEMLEADGSYVYCEECLEDDLI